MKLYEITLTHLAPKDSETAIKEYLVAKDDKAVFDYLSKGDGKEYTYWGEKIKEEYWEEEGWDNQKEMADSWIKNTLEHQGEHWNEDLYYDLYYGRTIYGWRETKVTDEECMNLMVKNGVAKFYE